MAITERDVEHVFDRLGSAVVPKRGLRPSRSASTQSRARSTASRVQRSAKRVPPSSCAVVTVAARPFSPPSWLFEAQACGFATSFVVVSDNDLHLRRFGDASRELVQVLRTISCPRGALGDGINRWTAKLEETVNDCGANEESPGFNARALRRTHEETEPLADGRLPEGSTPALRNVVFTLKQEGHLSEAEALLSSFSGCENVAAGAKKTAGFKGDIGSKETIECRLGQLEIVKAADYCRLVIVIDEVETVIHMRRDVYGKSLTGIRQIIDADTYPGLLFFVTYTPEALRDSSRHSWLQPLADSIPFLEPRPAPPSAITSAKPPKHRAAIDVT